MVDAGSDAKVHLLDIGSGKRHRYGDCLLCEFGDVSVLIDGGHRGDEELVMSQLKQLLNQTSPVKVSMIITSHPHDDHIGCLTNLVADGVLKADWALVCDPQYRWGNPGDTDMEFAGLDARVRGITEAALEHDRTDWDDDALAGFIDNVANLETRYRTMLRQLEEDGTRVVRYRTDKKQETELLKAFAGVGLELIGPSLEELQECFRLVKGGQSDALHMFDSVTDFDLDSSASVANAYRSLVTEVTDAPRNRGAINLQSLVTVFQYQKRRFFFAGDMQFADPQVESAMLIDGVNEIRSRIKARAPYAFVKLSHHGSDNAFDAERMEDYGDTILYGVCCGDSPGHHPHPDVLQLLDENRENVDWVRTDRNGLVSITFKSTGPVIVLSRGVQDDATPPVPDTDADVAFTDFAPPTEAAPQSVVDNTYTFTAKLPSNATRLSVTLDLQPCGKSATADRVVSVLPATSGAGSIDSDLQTHEAGDFPYDELTPNSADDVESEPGRAESFADADCNIPWRVAKSLRRLRDQVNLKAPNRNKASDGTIGDAAHCARTSDHNPWVRDGSLGIVTALDITHDPSHGCDANAIAEAIRLHRDARVKYIIWNKRIANSAAIGNSQPWQWRQYTGQNPHTRHIHISVKSDKPNYDSTADWAI